MGISPEAHHTAHGYVHATIISFYMGSPQQRTHLALIHNAPVGVDGPDLAVGVHAVRHGGREQPEAHAAAQQDVQDVVVLVVQSAERPCRELTP